MEIISHRGYWLNSNEKNTIKAFNRSFKLNFGTETDIRDFNGDLVISHDIPKESPLSIDIFFKEYLNYSKKLLALNIKSDGLVYLLRKKLEEFNITNYFVFDMSIPDTLTYINAGLNVFIRQSEIESDLSLYKYAKGIWLDAFYEEWYDENTINEHLKNGKKVCLVSSELHGRSTIKFWPKLKTYEFVNSNNLILCTDVPNEANKFFINAN